MTTLIVTMEGYRYLPVLRCNEGVLNILVLCLLLAIIEFVILYSIILYNICVQDEINKLLIKN
jgi:hypothetical protein